MLLLTLIIVLFQSLKPPYVIKQCLININRDFKIKHPYNAKINLKKKHYRYRYD